MLTISQKSINFIITQEVTSRSYYERCLSHPTWPGGDSGITIGIGYDLGYNTPEQIQKDWTGLLNEDVVKKLITVAGYKGLQAKQRLVFVLLNVIIPYEVAYKVFVEKTLPRFAKSAMDIYPGLDLLAPDAQGGILSMVFNRGNSLLGDRRTEMRAIAPLIINKDYEGIAMQIDKSKRLWVGTGLNGLIRRRQEEAGMVRNATRQYSANETVVLA